MLHWHLLLLMVPGASDTVRESCPVMASCRKMVVSHETSCGAAIQL